MKRCKNCKFFVFEKDTIININHGQCKSGKLLNGPDFGSMASDTAYGGGYDGCGDYIIVGKDFGCIHFKKKRKLL
jgi:hypothetical protein